MDNHVKSKAKRSKEKKKNLSSSLALSGSLMHPLLHSGGVTSASSARPQFAPLSALQKKGEVTPPEKPTLKDGYIRIVSSFSGEKEPERTLWKQSIERNLNVFNFNEFDLVLHWAIFKNFLAKSCIVPTLTRFIYVSFCLKEQFNPPGSNYEAMYKSKYESEYDEYSSTNYCTIVKGLLDSVMPAEITTAYSELCKHAEAIPNGSTSFQQQQKHSHKIETTLSNPRGIISLSHFVGQVPAKQRNLIY